MAAEIEKDLGIDVDMVHGKYGQYKVLVDDKEVFDGGLKVTLGIFPSVHEIEEIVRENIKLKPAADWSP